MNCLVIGDSIAVALQLIALQDCRLCAVGGWNSWQVNRLACTRSPTADVVVISLGTNDHNGVDTLKELYALRRRTVAGRVVWVLPWFSHVSIDLLKAAVRTVAHEYGDWVASTDLRENKRGIHPSIPGYRDLGNQVREIASE